MSQIRVLPDKIANQIAAGEVIERPAAVVKELLENSLDAGASRVEVVFRKGGMGYLKISDNGSGMSEEEALLALERHATSKLQQIEDLHAITSYGFRGEALPSIASVSRFLLRTRQADANTGTEILIVGGKIQHVRECGIPPGTLIEVDRLFFNVPARRKFLKSEETEASQIVHLLRLYSLASPRTAFTLKEDNRVILSTPSCPTLKDRIGELYGREITSRLDFLSYTEKELSIEGMAGVPELQRSTRNDILFFVNGRPVESRDLILATLDAYRDHIPRGRFPFVIVNLTIPPVMLDVNVHPTKREVRFREEARVRGLVIRGIWEFLEQQHKRSLATAVSPLPATPQPPSRAPIPSVVDVSRFAPAGGPSPISSPTPTSTSPTTDTRPLSTSAQHSATQDRHAPVPTAPAEKPLPTTDGAQTPSLLQQLPSWKFLSNLPHNLLLFSHSRGLSLVHVPSARSRIYFEQTLSQLQSGPLSSQPLVFPLPLELNPQEIRSLRESQDCLSEIGMVVEEFGKGFFRISAIPALVQPSQAEPLLRRLLTDSVIRKPGQEARIQIASLLSTWPARTEPPTTADEAFSLVQELLRCRSPMISPSGNPTLIEITENELRKRFFPQQRNSELGWDL